MRRMTTGRIGDAQGAVVLADALSAAGWHRAPVAERSPRFYVRRRPLQRTGPPPKLFREVLLIGPPIGHESGEMRLSLVFSSLGL